MARKLSDAMQSSNVDPTIIQACLAEYTVLDTEMKRLSQKQAAMFGRYEGQGVNKLSIKRAHKMSKLDKEAARSQLRTDTRYLIITGVLNPATEDWAKKLQQSDLFSEAEAEAPEASGTVSPDLARARAHSDGYNTGKAGGALGDNRFTPGTAEYVAWARGCSDGLADRKARGKAPVKVASGRPRGRPPGTGKKAKTNGQATHA